nr:DNA ligase (ATP) (EC 6.5.1.1) - bovine (fragments) [Bos taurus]
VVALSPADLLPVLYLSLNYHVDPASYNPAEQIAEFLEQSV